MIKVENIDVMNLQGAFRGMRNPKESWDKSDSTLVRSYGPKDGFLAGSEDLALAAKLANAGSDHSKFLRQIFVSVDITAPIYWWKEMDTYKVATVSNSCSTMHKITASPINMELFSFDENLKDFNNHFWMACQSTVAACENLRQLYIETKDKRYWRALVQLLPESWNQKRTWTANYATIRAIRNSDRKIHKLDEWRELIRIFDTLPYAKELLIKE
jgi:hypothetical protein